MWRLAAEPQDIEELSRVWRAGDPFPHLVFDDVVDAAALPALVTAIDEEPVDPYEGDIFAFEASAPEPRTDELRRVRDDFTAAAAPVLTRITGKPVSRIDLRAFAYREGHYLLPHTDHQDGLERVLAYVYYVPSPEPPVGGELELFRMSDHAIESARLVEPRGNRLVVFDVSAASLHQVREVLGGLRMSLAGWFYP